MAWIAGVMNLVGGRRDNYFNKEEADKARDWSKDMSNTEVQRRVQDMKLAGINPMLAATSGASTPGATAAAPARGGSSLGTDTAGAYFSAQQMKLMKEKNAADVAQVEAQTAKTAAETKLLEAQVPYAARNAHMTNENLYSQMHILANQVSTSKSEAEVKALLPEFQRLMNQAHALDMSEKEASAKFFKEIGEGSRWLGVVRDLLMSIRSMSGRN